MSVHEQLPTPWMYTDHPGLKGGTIHTEAKDEGGLSGIVCFVNNEKTAQRIIKAVNEDGPLVLLACDLMEALENSTSLNSGEFFGLRERLRNLI